MSVGTSSRATKRAVTQPLLPSPYSVGDEKGRVNACFPESGSFNEYDASSKGKDSKKPVSTAGLMVDRVPHEEWVEAFNEVWRRYRDYFYVDNMHGYDWEALKKQYSPLLDYVGHRADLPHVVADSAKGSNVGHELCLGGRSKVVSARPPGPTPSLAKRRAGARP